MPTEIKYEAPGALQAYLSTDLNSLANAAGFLGAKIDNVADGENEMFLAIELYVNTQGGARSAGGYVDVVVLYSVDDTNFSDTASLVGEQVIRFVLDAAVTARYKTRVDIPLAPFDFKLYESNQTGQAFAATGNTLKYRIYSLESQ